MIISVTIIHYITMPDTGRVIWAPVLCGQEEPADAFWSDSLSLNTSTPDVTVCFQRSVLLWVPCGWLWAASLVYIPLLYTWPSRHGFCSFSRLNLLKTVRLQQLWLLLLRLREVVAVLLVTDTVISLVLGLTTSRLVPANYMYYSIRCLTMILATVFVRWEFIKGSHSSGVLFIFWLLQFLCDVIIFRSWRLRQWTEPYDRPQFILFTIYFVLICLILLLHLFADKGAFQLNDSEQEDEKITLLLQEVTKGNNIRNKEAVDLCNEKTMPELYAPFWSKVTFLWVTGDVLRGYRKVITFKSLYNLRLWERCCWLVPRFYSMYNKGQSDEPMPLRDDFGQKRTRNSFLWSIAWAGGYTLIPGILLSLLSLAFRVLQPFILGELITFIESGDPHVWKGILLSVSLFVSGVISTIFGHNYLYCLWVGAMRIRGITNAIIYRKALRLSGSAKKATTVGEILNLMSVDAQKLQDAWIYGNLIWEVPMEVVVCTAMIWTVVGPSALAGVGVLGVLMPINGMFAANCIRKLQGTQMEHKDQRVKFLSEILSGIKIIKLYAWEPPFMKKLVNTRACELYYLKWANIVRAISSTIWFLSLYMISLAIFSTYVLSSPSNILDPNKAFVTLSLVNVMNLTIAHLPLGTSFLGQAIVSVERINKFLERDELDEGVVQQDASMEYAVSLTNATFSWEKGGRNILQSINLHVQPGQLVAVVGNVGSGKTALVSAILGEMSKKQGDIRLKGSLAYVPQQAWIQNTTVRNNVIFGRYFHNLQYETVLEATALLPDLQILPDGDSTEIGEKGINLSGGQKQRVSLARAVYQDEDIYLLDDPLSAVDAHVGKHIFEKVISNKGLLKHKTRIFVTHGISYLRYVDIVVVMKDGVISEIGSCEQLIKQRGAFADFLANYFNAALEYSSAEEDDIMAIHSELSAVSGGESGPESETESMRRPRKSRVSYQQSAGAGKAGRMLSAMSEIQPLKLIEDETAEKGNVRKAIIWRYVKAGGKSMFYITLLFQLLFTVAQVLTNLWLSTWSSDRPSANGTMNADLIKFRIGIYGALGIGQGITATVLLVVAALGCLAASRTLHTDMLHRLLRAPMAFFDTTPVGRIINRCSKDMDIIDTNMPTYLGGFFFAIGPVAATVFVISYSTPMFLIACIPILIIYIITQRMYIKYVRQLKRIDNIRRSPIYAHFDETISGTDSIRAYRRQADFTTKCDQLIDESQQPFYLILVAQRWLAVTMETVGSLISFFAALFAVLSHNTLSGGMAGLSVSYSLSITSLLNSLIRSMTELETYMVSVERVDEYCHIDQEADWETPETETDKQWPSEGHIQMEHYGTRYRPGLDLVLKDITCDISPGEKVGIVGRTGAGKSSLALALFRIIEAAKGFITIDGIPISQLGLHNLRSRLTVIPQEPVIFSGSLRQNLDPLLEYSETEVWAAVEKAHLKGFIENLTEGLDYECGEGGQALSVGQRQLVCLARAILRQTQVLMLDEATAAVDLETDALIQATIKDMYSACTILTIAHRLATVIDNDRIMVLDQGNVIEFDSPERLLAKTDSVFYSLAKEAGLV